jgi:branched-chain amino acid transport system ATP-binding protein
MLEVRNLTAGYGSLQILSEMSLSASGGKITAVVGPNGSGKSTLLKSIFGLTKIHSGEIIFDGQDLVGLPPYKIARNGISYLPQVESVFPTLTVEENLKMAGYTVPSRELNEKVEQISEMFPVLESHGKKKANLLSGGERQMLAMGMALTRSPKLIMFDEPTANLAPKIALSVLAKIVEVRDKLGPTIILVEQNARKALEIGERACLLVSGRTAFEGSARDLLAHPELGRLYLGVGVREAKGTEPSPPGG